MSNTGNISSRRSGSRLLPEFLGSMNLAITLLVAVGIASVIGTVLKQNEAYQNYLIKFGPFWFEVFNALGLYDVYSAVWFLSILTFLVISTSTCIYRNAPHMLADMRSYRLNVRLESLRAFHNRQEWRVPLSAAEVQARLVPQLESFGYRMRSAPAADHLLLAGRKGALNRLGYLFTHVAIVVICVGGLLDGNLPLKWRAFTGDIAIETRDIPASEVPEASRLPVSNPSFRGSVNVPEGASANILFLNLRDGYLVQPLPFSIEVKDFRIEHYSTGQPKSFESDLVIHDPERKEPLAATISVNHPLVYRGYSIYQASFSDGGSQLSLRLWPLTGKDGASRTLEGAVFEDLDINTSLGRLRLELSNFRLFNINPVPGEGEQRKLRNFGPNFSFRLRNEQGEALEYENYMSPVEMEGREFFLSGVRESPAEPLRYLYIPADAQHGVGRFMEFNRRLHDIERVRRVAERTAGRSVELTGNTEPGLVDSLRDSMTGLVALFLTRGYDGIIAQVEASVPEAERASVLDAYAKVLQTLLAGVYAELLGETGVDVTQGIAAADERFFDDAVNAVGALGSYGAPMYIQLDSFQHIQSTGLQIARAPGKLLVYAGFVLLIAGVFCMFYIAARRLWVWIDVQPGETRVLLAGSGLRQGHDFAREFTEMTRVLDAALATDTPAVGK